MMNFYRLSEQIRDGTLDLLITKPVSTLFLVTTRHVDFAIPVPNLIAGFVMIVLGWRRMGIPTDFYHIGGFALLLLCGILLFYPLYLFPNLIAFWTVKTTALKEFADKSWDFNNLPMVIYRKWMQRVGSYVIPVFIVFNVPAMFLWDRLGWGMLLWAFIAPGWFLLLVTRFWGFALRRYSSAGG